MHPHAPNDNFEEPVATVGAGPASRASFIGRLTRRSTPNPRPVGMSGIIRRKAVTISLSTRAFIVALAAMALAPAHAADKAMLPDATILPANIVQVSPSIPAMGEHWADPVTLPLGPIYCVHEGKIICLEFMMSQEDFAAGKSWPQVGGPANLPSIDHIRIGFQEHGHEGFEPPHYDMHIYFISPEEVAQIR